MCTKYIVTQIYNNATKIQVCSIFIPLLPVPPPSSQKKTSPWEVHIELHRIYLHLRSQPLWKMPKPTTTFLHLISCALLIYQQLISSLHLANLYHTKVALYCISLQLHLHLCVVLDHYVSLGLLLHNGCNLYQKTVNISEYVT